MHRDFDMLNRSRVDIRVIPAPHLYPKPDGSFRSRGAALRD
jgi:hypothetical protein